MRKLFYLCAGLILMSACTKKNPVTPLTPVIPSGPYITVNGGYYTTVVIGKQTWTTINYNGPGGIDLANKNADYGKLYTIMEAEAVALPAGWRLPAAADFDNLIKAAGNQPNFTIANLLKLVAKRGWTSITGTNSLGFNASPAGFYHNISTGMVWEYPGYAALFLTSGDDKYGANVTYTLGVEPTGEVGWYAMAVGPADYFLTNTDRGSIRFVKDN